ncbi:MAG: hypothetical protein LQ346_004762 [Caloplaca aetnensis]|nr:MAG: hypothetical protein LQ346_004762 [Caloplaca aetnensis]
MSKRNRSPDPDVPLELYKSNSVEDRSSRFLAYFSPEIPAKELQRHPDLCKASHRITAWRKSSSQRSLSSQPVFDTGHDDDGERYGGKTLEKVLVAANVVGAVVVARWYGGVMLGPVRFDHIRNCANEAIAKWRAASTARPAKQLKMHEQVQRREELIRILQERDQSIIILRGLLAEKKGQQASSSQSVKGSPPAKANNYVTLPLPALEKLENVRDATIGWILKEIEKAENAQTDKEAKVTEASSLTPETPATELVPEMRHSSMKHVIYPAP